MTPSRANVMVVPTSTSKEFRVDAPYNHSDFEEKLKKWNIPITKWPKPKPGAAINFTSSTAVKKENPAESVTIPTVEKNAEMIENIKYV